MAHRCLNNRGDRCTCARRDDSDPVHTPGFRFRGVTIPASIDAGSMYTVAADALRGTYADAVWIDEAAAPRNVITTLDPREIGRGGVEALRRAGYEVRRVPHHSRVEVYPMADNAMYAPRYDERMRASAEWRTIEPGQIIPPDATI